MSLRSTSTKKPLRDLLRNKDCKLCPLHESAKHVCLIGDGKWPADLMMVGEAPGDREDRFAHKPFAGAAGKRLDSILEVFDLPRDELFLSNGVKCRPPSNRDPAWKELQICSGNYLRREIKKVRPKLIVALGRFAAMSLLNQRANIAVGKMRGKIWYTSLPLPPNIPVVITYHPAATFREESRLDLIVSDFEWITELLKNPHEIDKQPDVDYKQLFEIPEDVWDAKYLAVDLETDGLDPFLGRKIISIQISTKPGMGYYFRWNGKIREQVMELLSDSSKVFIFHNHKYDGQWLRMHGIPIKGRIIDTMIAAHLSDENLPSKELDVLSSTFTPLKGHKDEMKEYIKTHDCRWDEVPLSIAVPYGCGDTDATFRLKKFFIPRLKKEGIMPLFRMQMVASEMYMDIEKSGFKVDTSLSDKLAIKFEKIEKKSERTINKLLGYELNPRSSPQVCKLIYDDWGYPPLGKKSAKTQWKPGRSSDKDSLNKLLEMEENQKRRDVIRGVLTAREVRKLGSTFVLGISDFLHEGDFIHPRFKLHGTVTGRPSCSDPPMQQIPRGDTGLSKWIKRQFVSRYGRDGVILSVDLSQAELRWFSHLSQEPTMLAAFRAGTGDFHRSTASQVLGKHIDDVTKGERKKAKTVNFGILYGSAAGKQAEVMGVSIKEAQEFINMWNDTFPGVQPYMRKVKKFIIQKGYMPTLFGRRRRVPISDPTSQAGRASLREGFNSHIQGAIGDYTVLCGIESWNGLFKNLASHDEGHIIGTVHDQVLYDIKLKHVDSVAPFLIDIFENPDLSDFGIELSLPMKAELSIGYNWFEQEVIYGN